MFRKAIQSISHGIAQEKLEQQFHLSKEQSKALAPLAIEFKKVWSNTDQERRMIVASLENIVAKSTPSIVKGLKLVKNDGILRAKIANYVSVIVTNSLIDAASNMLNFINTPEDETKE